MRYHILKLSIGAIGGLRRQSSIGEPILGLLQPPVPEEVKTGPLEPVCKQVPDLVNRMRALLKQTSGAGSTASGTGAAGAPAGKNVRTRQTCLLLLQELISCVPGVLATCAASTSGSSLIQHLVPGIVLALWFLFSYSFLFLFSLHIYMSFFNLSFSYS